MQTAATQHRVDVSAPPVLRAASFNAHGGDDDDDDVDIDEVNVHGSGAAMPIDRIVDRGAGHDRRAPSSRDVKRQQRQVASGPENYTESGYGVRQPHFFPSPDQDLAPHPRPSNSNPTADRTLPQGPPPQSWTGIGVSKDNPHAQSRAIHYWNWRQAMVGNSATVEDPPDPDEPEEDDAELYLLKDMTVPLLRDEKGKPAFVRRVAKRMIGDAMLLHDGNEREQREQKVQEEGAEANLTITRVPPTARRTSLSRSWEASTASSSSTAPNSLTSNPARIHPSGKDRSTIMQGINSQRAHMSVMAPPPQVAPFNPPVPPAPAAHPSPRTASTVTTLETSSTSVRGGATPVPPPPATTHGYHNETGDRQIARAVYDMYGEWDSDRLRVSKVNATGRGGYSDLSYHVVASSSSASPSSATPAPVGGTTQVHQVQAPPVPHPLSLEYQRQLVSMPREKEGNKGKRSASGKEDGKEEPDGAYPTTAGGGMFGVLKSMRGPYPPSGLPPAPTYTPYASSASTSSSSASPTLSRPLPPIRETMGSPATLSHRLPSQSRAHPPPPGLVPPSMASQRPPSASPLTSRQQPQPNTPWLYAGEEPDDEDDDGPGGASAEGGVGAGEDGPPKKRRRARVALSCAECKRRKIKCDRMQPCTPCARRGDQSNCKWAAVEAKDGAPSRAEFEAIQARLAHVERILQNVVPTLSANPAAPTQSPNNNKHPTTGNPYPAVETRRLSVSMTPFRRPSSPDPSLTGSPRLSQGQTSPNLHLISQPPHNQVKHEDRDHSEAAAAAAASSEGRPPTLKLLPEALRKNGSPGRLSGTTFPLSDADWEQMTSVALCGANKQRTEAGAMHVDVPKELEALVATLPSKESCDKLWAYYLERLEWQYCLLHPGAFQHMYDTFWALKTHAERAACTPIAWLALLLVVMSHALGSLRPAKAKAAGIVQDTPHWRMLSTQLWIASERALALDNFSHTASLEVVQTLILLAFRAISLDPRGWYHQSPILAMAIRLGLSIGLSNVPSDKVGEIPLPGLYKRELWRRIWFNVVYLDWRFSVPMGETYFINSLHYTTSFPSNLDWSDIQDGVEFQPKPRKTFTSASMFLARLHNSVRVRELCDALNQVGRTGAQDVSRLFYDHEMAVNETITTEPSCIISKDEAMEKADKRVQWARIGHTLELDYRAIQIHRSFLVSDFREARARAVCVDTADKMLLCFMEGRQIDAPNVWWWYAYLASVVLLMEQYYTDYQHLSADASARLGQKLENVMAYIAMQRVYDELTPSAFDGMLVLETLVAEVQKRRAAAGSRQQHVDASSLKRPYDQMDVAAAASSVFTVTRVPSSSPIHAFRKWILNVIPFLKLPSVPGFPSAHPRQRDMDASFWDAIFDLDFDSQKSSRRANFGKS